jgi:hypothetical protein
MLQARRNKTQPERKSLRNRSLTSEVSFPARLAKVLVSLRGQKAVVILMGESKVRTPVDHFASLNDEIRTSLSNMATEESVDRLNDPTTRPIVLARREALRASNQEMALYLLKILNSEQLARMLAIRDQELIEKLTKETSISLRPETRRRLRTSYEIAQMLGSEFDADYIRSWFYRSDPQLGGNQPSEAIRQGNLREALSAAQVFTVSGP